MIKHIILITIVILSLFACRKELDIDIPERDRKIVLNAVFHPDSLFAANVFMSNHVQDRAFELLYLNNAEVAVYNNDDVLLEKLVLVADGFYTGERIIAEKGKTYKILASVNNLPTVSSKVAFVDYVPIISIDSVGTFSYAYDEFYGENSDSYNRYHVKLKDKPEEDNFYRIKVSAQDLEPYDSLVWDPYIEDSVLLTYYPPNLHYDSEDPSIEVWGYHDGYFYFSDVLFDGKEYNFELLIRPPDIDRRVDFAVCLEHVTPDFYRYIKSYDYHVDAEDMGIFSQTAQVYNNIENGYGILGASTVSKDSSFIYGVKYDDEYKINVDY